MRKGRPAGSKYKKRRFSTKESLEARKMDIQSAIDTVFEEAVRPDKQFEADHGVTIKAVANELQITRATLYNWLKEGNLDFQDMKEGRIRVSNRKSKA